VNLRKLAMLALRYGLPGVLFAAGVAGIIAGHGSGKSAVAAGGVVLLGVALMVWMINWLFRMSLDSNKDRDREEEARDYFTEHGHWPGEPPDA
jgi:O-antigen/teichoic acid export membrane protein